MLVDFKPLLKTLEGREMNLGRDPEGKIIPATLGNVAIGAIVAPVEVNGQAQALEGLIAVERYNLANRIYEATEPLDLTVEEVALIKKRIAENYTTPLVVGQAWKMIEGK